MTDDAYLKISDVAKLFKVHPNTIRKWVKKESLPAKKVGGRFYVDRQILTKWVQENGQEKR